MNRINPYGIAYPNLLNSLRNLVKKAEWMEDNAHRMVLRDTDVTALHGLVDEVSLWLERLHEEQNEWDNAEMENN